MKTTGLVLATLLTVSATLPARSRELTFEERVEAQEAIDRVYYSHQSGATRSFEEAVPRAVLEEKVRKYLKQTAALEKYWSTPMTGEMLERELARMARDTRMPERLEQLFAALGRDAFLAQECLARPALVDRLTRSFFAADERIHGQARTEAEALHAGLLAGTIAPAADHPRRTVLELVLEEGGNREMEAAPQVIGLSPEEFAQWKRRLPARAGEVGALVEEREAFAVRVALDVQPAKLRVATFAVPKRSFDSWWAEVRSDLDEYDVRSRAVPGASLPATAGSGSSCPADAWDNGSLDDVPDPRIRATAVWTGSEMIVWGGYSDLTVGDGARYDPATDSWTRLSSIDAPQARAYHTAVWTGSEMIVWGGWNLAVGPDDYVETFLNSGGRYDPLSDSWTPTTGTGAPDPRTFATAVWTGSEMVVWGGEIYHSGWTFFNSGGRYDPVADSWAPTSLVDAPVARTHHAAAWTGGSMVVWGGYTTDEVLATGGRYDPATDSWTPTSTLDAPSERYDHTAVWTGDVVVIWGGGTFSPQNTGGRYDPVADSWTPTSTAGAPAARVDHTAVWTGTTMLVWGGSDGLDYYEPSSFDTGGLYDPAIDSWTPTSTLNAPAARSLHTGVWTGASMLVWGGVFQKDYGYDVQLGSGGRYDPASDTWTPTSIGGGPAARYGHTTVWTGNQIVVWGGQDPILGLTNTGGRYDPTTDSWSTTSTVDSATARIAHTAVWTGDLMVVWGGEDQTLPFPFTANGGGRYDPATDGWMPMSAFHAPDGRWNHTAVWTGSEMVVWGGHHYVPCGPNCGNPKNLDSGGRYSPAADTWLVPTSLQSVPQARMGHSAVWTGDRMLVWGGRAGPVPASYVTVDTGGAYDPATNSWTAITTTDAPGPRDGHTAIWTGDSMIVWGGEKNYDADGELDTGGRYDPATGVWTPTSTVDAPSARAAHRAVWTGASMIVWGGYDDNTGGRYDPGTDSWMPTSNVDAPAPRAGHSMVWTGSSMVVWGGSGLTSGGHYVPGLDLDTDGDGTMCAADCNDADAGAHAAPSEITGQVFVDAETMTWNSAAPAAGSATVHDVLVGLISEFPVGSGAGEACLASGIAESSTTDTGIPPSGDGFWYLIRGRNNCEAGPYGTDSAGTPRTSGACP